MKRLFHIVLILLLFCAGCSYMSVRHLNRNPWVLNNEQSVSLRYWKFGYKASSNSTRFNVTGSAHPKTELIPAWARSVDELWFAVYLSDSRGRVLARDLRVYNPMPIAEAGDIDFDFVLRPEEVEDGPLYVTFGYRMMLKGDTEEQVFFGSESALTLY